MILSSHTQIPAKSIKKKFAALYVRVSSRQQKEEETISSQLDALLCFSKEQGYEIAKEYIFCDDGYTGTSLDRPGLDELRDVAREGFLGVIFVYSPDRIARDYVLQLILEAEFCRLEIKLMYLKGATNRNTPEDIMLARFQGIFAEYERAQIIDRTRRGKLYKARQGNLRILPSVPFGYYSERNDMFYKVKESEAKIVRKIFHLFTIERLSLRQIARQLEEEGISSPKGSLSWYHSTITGILENTAYVGTAYFGKTEKCAGNSDRIARYESRGKVIKPINPKRFRPQALWEPLPVPQIISESDFEVAKDILEKNKGLSARNTKIPSILQGVIVCGLCGKSYYKKVRSGNQKPLYHCRSHLVRGPRCGNRSLQQEELDRLIWNNIIELLQNPDLLIEEINRRYSAADTEKSSIKERKSELEREIKNIEKGHNKLLDAYQEGDCLTLDDLRKRSKILKEKEKILKKELEALEAAIIRKASYQDLMNTLMLFRKKLEVSYNVLSVEDKQKIIRALIEDIIVFPDKVEVLHVIPSVEPTQSFSPLWTAGGCSGFATW